MKRLIQSASRTIISNARKYPAVASAIVALCGASMARADTITTAINSSDNATVQTGGPRSGSNGKAFFNLEGDGTSVPSYGVLDFNAGNFSALTVTDVDALTLSFKEANASFSHPGSVEVYLASDSTANIQPNTYTVPAYAVGSTPYGFGSTTAFGTLWDLGSIAFNTTGNPSGSGTISDLLSLSSLSTDVASFLTDRLNDNGTIRFVLTTNAVNTAATWAGSTYSPAASRPSLSLTFTGSLLTFTTLLWTGGANTWDTGAINHWQVAVPNDRTWDNASGNTTIAAFNTTSSVSVVASGITARSLDFRTGTNGMSLNGPGALTLVAGGINVASSSSITIAASISAAAGIELTGGGTLSLTNTSNDIGGKITLTSGVLPVADTSSTILGNATVPIYMNGGSLRLTAANGLVRDLLVSAGTLDTGGFDVTFSGHITNAGGGTLTRIGTGALTMTTPDANPPGYFNGGTFVISQGKVVVTDQAVAGGYCGFGSGTLVVQGGATLSFVDTSDSGGLQLYNGPAITLNAGGSLTASAGPSGGTTTLTPYSGSIRVGAAAGTSVIDTGGLSNHTFLFTTALRSTATGSNFSVVKVTGSGILQMASGATSASANPSSPAFAGSWDVSMDPAGILSFGPLLQSGLGEVLNSPGYPAPAVGNASNTYQGVTNLITVHTGTVVFGADAVNPNNTTNTLTIVSFRSPLVLNGGNIASTSYEYDTDPPNAPPGSGPGTTVPVSANLGADITVVGGSTATVLLYDPVLRGASDTRGSEGRYLNIMTDPNALAPDGTAVSTNLTWGANSTLVVDATGVTSNFGALNFNRTSGNVSVGLGAKLQINSNAIVNLGGTQDALNDGANRVNVIDNGLLQITGGSKGVGGISGSGIVHVGLGTILTSDGVNLPAGSLIVAGTQTIRSSGTTGAYYNFATGQSSAMLTGTSKIAGAGLNITGTLDIKNNALIVEAADSTSKATLLQTLAGELGTVITSSTSTTNSHYTMDVIDNGKLGASFFGGLPVDANSILVTEALKGDANLDGNVTLADLTIWKANFGKANSYAANVGDFNHDGNVTLADLTLWKSNFGAGVGTYPAPSDASTGGLILPTATYGSGISAVPEPASLAVLALGAVGLLRRRKR